MGGEKESHLVRMRRTAKSLFISFLNIFSGWGRLFLFKEYDIEARLRGGPEMSEEIIGGTEREGEGKRGRVRRVVRS